MSGLFDVPMKGYDQIILRQQESTKAPQNWQVCTAEAERYRSIQGNYPKPSRNLNKPTPVMETNIAACMMERARALATLPNVSFISATDLNKIAEDIISMFSPVSDQDIFVDDLGSSLKDRLGKKLKPDVIAYYEKMETAFLSESSLAKDWLTPEEDEAWKDL